jgi:predicted  nucleic acid-binding Zn-ribbon protein
MSQSIVVEILLSVLAVMIGIGSFVGASRANKAQADGAKSAIDANAYLRAKEIYEGAIDALQDQIVALREQMVSLDTELTKLQQTNRNLILRVSELQDTNLELIKQIGELKGLEH